MKNRGRHAAPGPADRVFSSSTAAPWDSTEVLDAVAEAPSAHHVARRKLLNLSGKTAAVLASALVLAVGVFNSDLTDAVASPQLAGAPAYLDLRAETLSSRAVVERAPINEDRVVVTITADGETVEQPLGGGTVKDALEAAGIVVGQDDIVSEHLETALEEGLHISIARVGSSVVTEEVTDEYTTSKVDSSSLYKGEEKVTTPGIDGVSQTTYRVTLVDGEEASREAIAAVVSQERQDEVISVGTKDRPVAQSSGTSSSAPSSGPVVAGSNREIGQSLAAARGWTGDQWQCLDSLWKRESNWNHTAYNSSSGAYGIPQALPGSKMGSVAADWRTNPATQITWGLNYIAGRYGNPCGAWASSQSRGWY